MKKRSAIQHSRLTILLGVVVLMLPLSGLGPTVAQDHGAQPQRTGLALFLTWLPMLVFLGIMFVFYGFMRRAMSRAKQYEGHPQRVEALLERIAKAVERERRPD